MCSPKRILETMGIGAMLGVMRLAVWRLPRTTEAVTGVLDHGWFSLRLQPVERICT